MTDTCPVCGDPYNKSLSGVVADGQPLDVRDKTRICTSRDHDVSHKEFYSYIHTDDHDWDGELLEFSDTSGGDDD